MRYGIAVWNYRQEGISLHEMVNEFAGFGFSDISFLPSQITSLDEEQAENLISVMDTNTLGATVHGNFNLSIKEIIKIIDLFGDKLYSITFDPAMMSDSRGTFYDVKKMSTLLAEIQACSHDTELRFAIEDFPLDGLAIDHYQDELNPLLDYSRFGVLIDIGHMNLRIRHDDYFRRYTLEEYLSCIPLPIIEVHVHDNAGEKDSHGHIGFGSINFAAAARGLRGAGFEGISTIEIAPSFHGSTPEESKPLAKESLSQWRIYLEEISNDC